MLNIFHIDGQKRAQMEIHNIFTAMTRYSRKDGISACFKIHTRMENQAHNKVTYLMPLGETDEIMI